MGEQDEAVFQVALVRVLLSEELATAKVSVLVVVARDEGCRSFEVVDVFVCESHRSAYSWREVEAMDWGG